MVITGIVIGVLSTLIAIIISKFVSRIIDSIKKHIERTKNRKRYCKFITRKFKLLNFPGLFAILPKGPLLEEIYVKLKIKESRRTIADFQKLDEEKDFITLFEQMREKASGQKEPLKLVIQGPPGSGKTTLMKWIALQCTSKRKNIFSSLIPVFISLQNMLRALDQTFLVKNIMDSAIEVLNAEFSSISFIREEFKTNKLLFLLDGLDEVGDESLRGEIIEWIQNQFILNNTLLVTSRKSGLDFNPTIPVYTIQDFDIADIQRFLENLYRNIKIALASEADQKNTKPAIEEAQKQCENLMDIIKDEDNKSLRQMAENPLLLTIIAVVHRTRRGQLPLKCHELCEECLKVMIELQDNIESRTAAGFSVESSMGHLSQMALFMMKNTRKEMEHSEIKALLPSDIDEKQLDFFLEDMDLKAGLLYKSGSKYGFLHLTFQEYLAARYFAHNGDQKNQDKILEYRDNEYWNGTFKLFVNMVDTRQFFHIVIDRFQKKDYWKQMRLWEDCLLNVEDEEMRNDIEIQSAGQVLKILSQTPFKEKNEDFIISLYAHYPLFKYAAQFVTEAWKLFNNDKYPFVQSVGSSILNEAGEDNKAELIEAIKKRIHGFGKQDNKSRIRFIYQNSNSFVLVIAARRNLLDFHFAVEKLKSNDLFLIYLELLDFQNILCGIELLELLDFQGLLEVLKLLDVQGLIGLLKLQEHFELLAIRDILKLRDFLNLRDQMELRNFVEHQFFRTMAGLLENYNKKYQSIFEDHKKEIDAWADKAITKLHLTNDEELLKFFPGTTKEEIKKFKYNYPPFPC